MNYSALLRAAGLAALVTSGVQAQQDAALDARLDALEAQVVAAEDVAAIKRLQRQYGYYVDKGMWEDVADLYTADGAFVPDVAGRTIPPITGREALARVSGGGTNNCQNVAWIEQGIRHIYTNHIITPSPEGATGTVDMLMIGLDGDPYKIAHDGYYDDVYVKTPQGWRFKQRTHHALLDAGRPVTQAAPPAPAAGAASSGGAR